MNQPKIINYLVKQVNLLNGVGSKTMRLLKKKKIEKVSDLLLNFPGGHTDRTIVKK